MPDASLAAEVTLWVDDQRASLAGDLIDVIGSHVRPLGVGGPRSANVDALASRLDIRRLDDPRQLIVEHPAAYLLLAAAEPVPTCDLAAAINTGTHVLCFEPPAQTLNQFDEIAAGMRPAPNAPAPGGLTTIPSFIQGRGLLASTDPQKALGDQRSIAVTSVGSTIEGSLFARLLDAWQTVLAFAEVPDTIDASLSGPLPADPEDPRGMTGRLTAHARLPDGGSAVLLVADCAAAVPRGLHVVGTQGALRASDTGYELRQTDGTMVDQKPPATTTPGFIDLAAAQWKRLLNHRTPANEPSTRKEQASLACALACLLSARTGDPESPQRLVEMSKG